jgi:hypothetical protein
VQSTTHIAFTSCSRQVWIHQWTLQYILPSGHQAITHIDTSVEFTTHAEEFFNISTTQSEAASSQVKCGIHASIALGHSEQLSISQDYLTTRSQKRLAGTSSQVTRSRNPSHVRLRKSRKITQLKKAVSLHHERKSI